MGTVILLSIGIYIFLSIKFVKYIWKVSKKQLYKYLAIPFVIIFPTWDILLGAIIYYPACRFVPKVAIYKTAETEGIYYEGVNNYIYELEKHNNEPLSERTQVGDTSGVLEHGYSYIEAKVTEKKEGYLKRVPITPIWYRCTLLPRDVKRPAFTRTDCQMINMPSSRYVVKVATTKIVCGVKVRIKKIMDNTTGKLLAEYHQVAFKFNLPFFNWLGLYDHPKELVCPQDRVGSMSFGRYEYFDFNVLKPKK